MAIIDVGISENDLLAEIVKSYQESSDPKVEPYNPKIHVTYEDVMTALNFSRNQATALMKEKKDEGTVEKVWVRRDGKRCVAFKKTVASPPPR
jgi:hypothetical protein